MIIRALEFYNFLRFFDTSTLDLSATKDAESALAPHSRTKRLR